MKLTKWIMALALATPVVTVTAYADDTPNTSGSEMNKEVQMSDLPAAVQTAVQKEAKGKSVGTIEKESANGKTFYKVEIGSGSTGENVKVSETGHVLSRAPLTGTSGETGSDTGMQNQP